MMSIRIIARLTVREAIRRKVILGLLILSVVYLLLYALGLAFMKSQMRLPPNISANNAYNFLLIAGLYAVNFLIVMLAVLISVDTLAGEIDSGTIQAIAVKPLRRRDILLGKWLAFVIMLGLATLVLAGGVMLITWLITGYVAAYSLPGLALMYLETLVLLSVSLLGGTRFSTLANGVLGFGLFGLAFVGGWIEQIGSLLNNEAVVSVGHIGTLIMPSEAVWRLALSNLAEGVNPFRFLFALTAPPDPRIVLYAVAFAAVILLLALRSFQRRDL
jgi:Cu-processing system permease protein